MRTFLGRLSGYFFGALLLASTQTLSAQQIYPLINDGQAVVLQDDDHWVLDVFAKSPDGFPDRISHENFNTRDELQTQLDKLEMLQDQNQRVGPKQENKELRPPQKNPSDQAIWPVTHEWSIDWEIKYNAWVKAEFTPDFFQKANWPTVCSDVAYALRWIFAHNNGLPAANRLSTGGWFTHRSLRDKWRNLPTDKDWTKDQRFRGALTYLSENTYTHTLWDDSYTVEIDMAALQPGAYHINKDGGYGHTMIVYKVSSNPQELPLVTLSSTTPRAVRLLNQFVYSEVKSKIKPLALFHMRWPDIHGDKVGLVKSESMPWYSAEQDDPGFVHPPRTRFWEEVFFRLNPQLNFAIVVEELRNEIHDAFLRRVDVVKNGLAACAGNRCKPGTSGWEDWSTVSFDERLSINIAVADEFLEKVPDHRSLDAALTKPLLNIEGHALTFGQAMDIWRAHTYTADPADSIARRWGFDPPPPPKKGPRKLAM
jgi:hypothetical protein